MASKLATRTQDLLGHDKLGEVDGLLRKLNYDDTTFFKLGLQLGLRYATLNKIRAEHQHSIGNCLIECLNAWIEQVDDVKEKGGPSYYTLIVALRNIKQIRVADAIDKEKHPACAILAYYKDETSILNPLPQLAVLLYKEDLIRAKILPNVDVALNLLKEVQQFVCANHRNLMKFADVLKLMSATQKIAREIKKSYLEKVHSNEIVDEAEVPEITDSDISIQGKELDAVNAIRKKFASTVYDATEAMAGISEKDLRNYLRRGYSHLASKLEKCRNIDELLDMVANECSLTDVSLLEAVADKFKITPAIEFIQKYKEAVDDFCEETPLTECLNKKISSGSLLESEKIVISVKGQASEHKFKDVKELTEHAFGKLNSQVKITVIVVKKSFSVTCSFPLILSESLIASVLQNLEILKAKGLEQLTIGYGIVYDVDEKEFDEAAVYARKGIVEQLLLSRTVQLINCCQEKKAIIAEAEKKKIEYQEEKEMLSKNLISCQQSDIGISADIATIVYAAMTRHKHIINIELISEVTHMFRKYQFYGDKYYKFGTYLNIPEERLGFIERNFKGDLARCLIECLMAWLRNPDDPSTKSWETLILAIRHVDEKEIADNIYNEKCKPCEVLSEYYVKLFESIQEPFELADILYSKGVLDETSLTKIKKATKEEKTTLLKARELLLQVIPKSICRKKENLQIFAEALQEFSSTAELGDEILKNVPL